MTNATTHSPKSGWGALPHGRHCFYLGGVDIIAAADDEILCPPGDGYVAFVVNAAEVPGPEEKFALACSNNNPTQSISTGTSAAIKAVMSLQYSGNTQSLLSPNRSLCPRPGRSGQTTRRPLPASEAKMIKISPLSGEAMHAYYRAISSRGSPIGKRNAMKAPPRQSANRSHSIRNY